MHVYVLTVILCLVLENDKLQLEQELNAYI